MLFSLETFGQHWESQNAGIVSWFCSLGANPCWCGLRGRKSFEELDGGGGGGTEQIERMCILT